MEYPEDFSTPGQEKKVCKLVKSLYRLKQAPKQWHDKFENVMMSHEFKIKECDNFCTSKTWNIDMSLHVRT